MRHLVTKTSAALAFAMVTQVGSVSAQDVLILAEDVPAGLNYDGPAAAIPSSQQGMVTLLEPLVGYGDGETMDGVIVPDFSSFEGLTRILTVIKGSGMVLHSEGAAWPADFAVPVTFDGAAPVTATLGQGPVRDFNLMFDTARCTGTARCSAQAGPALLGTTGQTSILHVISGTVTLTPDAQLLGEGDTVVSDTAPLAYGLHADTCVLAITLQQRA